MTEPIEVGGARYRVVERATLRQDLWITTLLQRAGLVNPMPAPGESADAFATRVVAHANAADVLFDLLGATLMPEGVAESDWTIEGARAIGLHLGNLQDEADKQRVRRLIAEVLLPFMRAGLASFVATPTASPAGVASPGQGESSSSPSTASGTG